MTSLLKEIRTCKDIIFLDLFDGLINKQGGLTFRYYENNLNMKNVLHLEQLVLTKSFKSKNLWRFDNQISLTSVLYYISYNHIR